MNKCKINYAFLLIQMGLSPKYLKFKRVQPEKLDFLGVYKSKLKSDNFLGIDGFGLRDSTLIDMFKSNNYEIFEMKARKKANTVCQYGATLYWISKKFTLPLANKIK